MHKNSYLFIRKTNFMTSMINKSIYTVFLINGLLFTASWCSQPVTKTNNFLIAAKRAEIAQRTGNESGRSSKIMFTEKNALMLRLRIRHYIRTAKKANPLTSSPSHN
jgi:hypothetical protein